MPTRPVNTDYTEKISGWLTEELKLFKNLITVIPRKTHRERASGPQGIGDIGLVTCHNISIINDPQHPGSWAVTRPHLSMRKQNSSLINHSLIALRFPRQKIKLARGILAFSDQSEESLNYFIKQK